MARVVIGQSPSGLLGYSHMMGGYAGGQAEHLRVPYADIGPVAILDGIGGKQVLFLSNILPTGYKHPRISSCAYLAALPLARVN